MLGRKLRRILWKPAGREGAGAAAGALLPFYLPLPAQRGCGVPAAGDLRGPAGESGGGGPHGRRFRPGHPSAGEAAWRRGDGLYPGPKA